MIQSLRKAFRVLELLADDQEQALPLGIIADTLDLHKATCAHVLKTLGELGYVEQLGPRQGYRLGPMAYALPRGRPYRRDLVAAAEPLMAELAREVRETVLLAALHRGRRFTLCQIGGTQDVQVKADPMVAVNVYQTATGRLLLAHARTEEAKTFVRAAGLPGEAWPEVRSETDLRAALAAIREAGQVVNVTPTHVVALAWPVIQNGCVVAALGLFLPEFRFTGKHKAAVLAGMERTAAAITEALGDRDDTDSTGCTEGS